MSFLTSNSQLLLEKSMMSLAPHRHPQDGIVLVDGLVNVLLLVGVAHQLHHLVPRPGRCPTAAPPPPREACG